MFAVTKISPQEKLGMSNSNYMPSYSAFLNPSNTVDSWTHQQINFVGINAYFMNNIAYLPKFRLWSIAKQTPTLTLNNSKIQEFLRLKQFMYVTAEANGPAYFISKGLYSGGLFVRVRSVLNFINVPYQLTNMLLNQQTTGKTSDEINQKNVRLSNMSWMEAGLNFGRIIKRDRFTLITLAGNLKYISGINIAYGNLKHLKGYYNSSVLAVESLRGKVYYNQAKLNSGKGFGLDVGVTYKKMLGVVRNYYTHSVKSNCKYVDYKYKLGISLRDAGFVRFKTGTEKINAEGSANIYSSSSDGLLNSIKDNFNVSTVSNAPILASLPLSASAQFDYNFENSLFLNITVIKNLVPNNVVGAQGSNLISICPRFERKQVEVALPINFQRFIYPQLGLALRYRSIVLGFDNVFPLVIRKNTYGANVYISIGATAFVNPDCHRTLHSVDSCPPALKFLKPKRKRRKPH